MSLLEYCTTDRQRQIVELHEQGLGYTKISQQIGIGRLSVRDCIKNVKNKAAAQGYSPEHDMVRTVPETFKIKVVCRPYYNEDGKPVSQWVKSMADRGGNA